MSADQTEDKQAETKAIVGDFSDSAPKRSIKNLLRKKAVLFATVVILLLAIGFGWIMYGRNDSGRNKAACSDEILREAAQALDDTSAERVTKLKGVVDKIQATKNYETDKNCLYPVVSYYISISDEAKAKEYFGKLEAVHDGLTFSPIFEYQVTLEDLRAQIAHLETAKKEYINNMIFFDSAETDGQ